MTDPRGLFVELDEGDVAEAEEVAPGVTVEFNAERQPLAVDIADVHQMDVDVLTRALTSLQLPEAEVLTVVEALKRAQATR